MGCDIHAEIDLKQNGIWKKYQDTKFNPFPYRNYNLFDFLTNVRSCGAPAIAFRRGLTEDRAAEVEAYFEEMNNAKEPRWGGWDDSPHQYPECHNISWVLLSELITYDYDTKFLHSETKEEMSIRDYLGNGYFENLAKIRNRYPEYSPEEIRIFFYFDN